MATTYYIPHGGGPMPLLDERNHKNMNDFFRQIGRENNPDAIVVFSAHYETEEIVVIYDNVDELVYDYYGFPRESYTYQYKPPKDIVLGKRIYNALNKAKIPTTASKRGFDHGVFVPLLLMYPKADIPVIQISLHKNLDPEFHIKLGKALQFLQEENVLIIGSGYSFHNLREFMREETDTRNNEFHDWLFDVISQDSYEKDREESLVHWRKAPHARYVHPRSEHLIPLHICYGINQAKGEIVFDDTVYNKRTFGIKW